ncbi:PREDICTED: auxin transport BIG [Prunus dulcis]|uniref:PREDICTED: auxin transport BIG n=1 Tax=Prunus dulcis TaxID=3755 RepID=A0A5E4FQG4_PRUDU|nr:PREDICTED: auxin transport BIG [Prunus dulcis]
MTPTHPCHPLISSRGCALIPKRCVEVVGDGKLGLQSWADSQIQAVYSIAYAIASASRSLLLMKCCE